jgi:RNA polymerase sigma factor (sigma-70 family)
MIGGDTGTDGHLTCRWRSGDRAAGDELCQRYAPLLRRFFNQRAMRECEDLVQQTLLIALERQRQLVEEAPFRAYVFGVARIQLLAFVRKQRRESLPRTPLEDPIDPGANACDLLGANASFDSALSALPDEFKEVMRMIYRNDLSAPEIARELSIPVATVYSRLRRARDRLQHLKD